MPGATVCHWFSVGVLWLVAVPGVEDAAGVLLLLMLGMVPHASKDAIIRQSAIPRTSRARFERFPVVPGAIFSTVLPWCKTIQLAYPIYFPKQEPLEGVARQPFFSISIENTTMSAICSRELPQSPTSSL